MEPKLRFKEFSGDWEESTIGDVFTFISTNSLSRNDLNYVKGDIYNVHYGDIHMVYPTITDAQKEVFPYINQEVNLKIDPENFCQNGDVLLADASEDYDDIGKSIEIININDKKVLAGLHIIFMRDYKGIYADKFKGFMMNSNSVKHQIKVLSCGAKVLGISKSNIVKVKIPVPSLPEQTKIADFLSTVDEKIQNQQDKITHLENIKKGFMQKIFSRKIRFKDANGNEFPEWEEKKLEDTIETIIDNRGKTPPISSSGYPLIEIASMQNNGLNYRKIEKYVSDETYKTWFRNHIKADDILFSTVGAYSGSLSYYDGKIKSCIAQNIIGLRFAQNSKFMMYLLSEKENQKRIQNIKMNQAQPSIKVTQMIKLKFLIPCLKEQQKIADFLSSFDEKIDVEKEILDHLKELKKGLLQQMFV